VVVATKSRPSESEEELVVLVRLAERIEPVFDSKRPRPDNPRGRFPIPPKLHHDEPRPSRGPTRAANGESTERAGGRRPRTWVGQG